MFLFALIYLSALLFDVAIVSQQFLLQTPIRLFDASTQRVMQRPGVAYHEVNQTSSVTRKKWRSGLPTPNVLATGDSGDSGRRELIDRKHQRKASLRNGDSKDLPHYFNRLTSDSWVWELLGIFVCIATLVSIFGILVAYDQKPLPHTFAGVSVRYSH